jgi:hypothetical protein
MIAVIVTLWYATSYVIGIGSVWTYIAIIKTEYAYLANQIDEDTRRNTINECLQIFLWVVCALGGFFFLLSWFVTISTIAGHYK